jgi:CRP-like cAMP-binding protein
MEQKLSHLDQSTTKNRILASLPELEFARLAKSLVRAELAFGEPLQSVGDKIENVYFVESGFISAMAILSDGSPLEIGLIGSEGVAGASVILGATTSSNETMCQTGGGAYRSSAAALKDVSDHAPVLRDLLLRYLHIFHVQVAQTAVCNVHHELGQRLARWLLAAHDRSGVAQLSLTQDLIAGCGSFHRECRCGHAAEGRRDQLPTRADHHSRSRGARERGLRML